MKTYRPRRDFIKRLLALPLLLSAPPLAAAAPMREHDLYLFPVAGFQFHDGPLLLTKLQPNMALELVAEPHNRHDPQAIRIEARGRHIGYVPRHDNGPLGRLLQTGAPLRARVLSIKREGEPWDAVRVAVSMPLAARA
jgi:hypothetical protein